MAAFKKGMLVGFAIGYVYGSKAGRDRYEQINKVWKKVKQTPSYQAVAGKAGAAISLGIQRGKIVALENLTKSAKRTRAEMAANGKREYGP